MTSTGLLLIPLALGLPLMPWQVILMALPLFALLHGAAVVNLGSVGLQPGYFLALLVIARTGLEIALLRQPLNREALILVAPLGVLVVISILVLWLSVAFFAGEVVVIGGTDGLILERARPYMFRRENVTQIAYIVINTTLVYAIAHQAARLHPGHLLRAIDRGLVVAALFALAICIWQLLAHSTGVYFPSDFLFSNAGYFRADGQAFFGSLRLNGPFAEPSALAYFFAGFLFYSWKRARLQPTVLSAILVLALIAAIFLAFSTTGYFVLATFAMLAALDLLTFARLLRVPRFTSRRVAIAAVLLLAVGGAALWASDNWDRLNTILEVSLFEKEKTSSFETRTGVELMALEIVAHTGGLGIGLGSHKANTLTLTLLSNLGVAGTAVFVLFVVMLLCPRRRASAFVGSAPPLTDAPLRFFIIALLLVHAVSNPNFNVIMLWIGFGLMAGYRASLRSFASAPQDGRGRAAAPLRRRSRHGSGRLAMPGGSAPPAPIPADRRA